MSWKNEIKKYDNEPALKKLHSAILEFVETDDVNRERNYDNPFNDTLTSKLYKILNMIEPKINKTLD